MDVFLLWPREDWGLRTGVWTQHWQTDRTRVARSLLQLGLQYDAGWCRWSCWETVLSEPAQSSCPALDWDWEGEVGACLQFSPISGVDKTVEGEAVVEVTVELSTLTSTAAEGVVVNSTVEMQTVSVLWRFLSCMAVVGMVVVMVIRTQGRNVPVGQLVHQSQGPLSSRGPWGQCGHAAVKVVVARGGSGGRQSWRRQGGRGGQALVVVVQGVHVWRRRPKQLRTLGGLGLGPRPSLLRLCGPRHCRSSCAAGVRAPLPFSSEIPVVKHLFTVWVQSPVISFAWKYTDEMWGLDFKWRVSSWFK